MSICSHKTIQATNTSMQLPSKERLLWTVLSAEMIKRNKPHSSPQSLYFHDIQTQETGNVHRRIKQIISKKSYSGLEGSLCMVLIKTGQGKQKYSLKTQLVRGSRSQCPTMAPNPVADALGLPRKVKELDPASPFFLNVS